MSINNKSNRILALTGVTVSLLLGVATKAEASPQQSFEYQCAGTVVLAVDGTKGLTTPDSIDPESPLNPIADTYRGQPNTAVYHVAYPGGMIPGVAGWEASYDESKRIGKSNVRSIINDLETKCDGTPIQWKLLGFSQGADIVGDIAAEIDSDQTGGYYDLAPRTEAFLYADPRANIGSTERELAPGITMEGPRRPYKNVVVHTFCASGDIVCDPRGNLVDYFLLHVQGAGYQP